MKKTHFIEVGGVWNSKSGKSLSGMLDETVRLWLGLPEGSRVLVMKPKSDNPNAPKFQIKILIPGEEEGRKESVVPQSDDWD